LPLPTLPSHGYSDDDNNKDAPVLPLTRGSSANAALFQVAAVVVALASLSEKPSSSAAA
jgi:hypothetical protein